MNAAEVAAAALQIIQPFALVVAGFVAGRIYGSLDVLARLFTRGGGEKK